MTNFGKDVFPVNMILVEGWEGICDWFLRVVGGGLSFRAVLNLYLDFE